MQRCASSNSHGNHRRVGSKMARPQDMFANSLRNLAEEINRKQKEIKVHKFVHEQTSEWMSSRSKADRVNLGQ